ncbi:MAG: hypothetical protein IV093_10740 [Rubrivivax sp.]|nr:hypothetical protein [Rubrivivax sp.]
MRPPRRGLVVAAVLLLHLLVLVSWRLGPAAPAALPAVPTSWLRLLPATPAPVAEPPDRLLPTSPARPTRPVQPAAPQAITLPAPVEAGPTSTAPAPALPAPAATGAAGAAPPPLDLRLPPPPLRGAAPLRPPAENRPRSVESTLSGDLANGPLIEEDLGNGRRRFRQGRRCAEVRDSRAAQIDPFNQSVSPVPKQVEDCSR